MRRIVFVFVFLLCSAAVKTTFAELVFDIVETGGNVEVTMSGEIDLAATSGFEGSAFMGNGFYLPLAGTIGLGVGDMDTYRIDVAQWTPFGPGDIGLWDQTDGSAVVLTVNPFLSVPDGYVSESSLSGTATKFDATFASLGFSPGTYVTTLTNGINIDTLTVNVGAVPEPGSLVLLTIGVCGILALARTSTSRTMSLLS